MFTPAAQKAASLRDFKAFTDEYLRTTKAEPCVQTYKRIVKQYELATYLYAPKERTTCRNAERLPCRRAQAKAEL